MEKLKSKPLEQQKGKTLKEKAKKPVGTVDIPKAPYVDTDVSLKDSKTYLTKVLSNETFIALMGESGTWDRWARIIIIMMVLFLMTFTSISKLFGG